MVPRDLEAQESWKGPLGWWLERGRATTLCYASVVCDAGLAISQEAAGSELSAWSSVGLQTMSLTRCCVVSLLKGLLFTSQSFRLRVPDVSLGVLWSFHLIPCVAGDLPTARPTGKIQRPPQVRRPERARQSALVSSHF